MYRPLTLLSLLFLATTAGAQHQVSGRLDDRAVPGTLPLEEIRAMLADAAATKPYEFPTLPGLPEDLASFVPADNPMTNAKVELGRQLYFDKRLSRDGTVSCATCHDPARGWTDTSPVSTGIAAQKGGRSAPTVTNRLFGKTQFWDGRAASLEEQALGPIANPVEMGFTHDEAIERLNQVKGYVVQFAAVFGTPVTADGIAKAIAAFERTILSGGNKNDYYEAAERWFDWDEASEDDAEVRALANRALDLEAQHRMSPSAERGRALFFGKASCSACHVGADLTDEMFHNIGVQPDDPGRSAVTGDAAHTGAFKTPSLRNIALTAPYMHDGSLKTLVEVVEHYNKGGTPNDHLSEKIFPLKLTPQEVQDVARFMEEALTGPVTEVEVPRLP
ncbi:MAG: c-type cytochrome [Planctomycetes bacterium]|nr:c-type cytochrome [Planctomycetota bacterium]